MVAIAWFKFVKSGFPDLPLGVSIHKNNILLFDIDLLLEVNESLDSFKFLVIISLKPGSKKGTVDFLSFAILFLLVSMHVTWCPRSAKHAPVTYPTYPEPIIVIFIFLLPYLKLHI